jgi:fimbrial isopeptide formation D2 family protein/LPXTG-motif cell wall-anchored protein
MRMMLRVLTLGSLFGLALSPLLAPSPAVAGINFDVSISKTHTGDFTVGDPGVFTITLQHESNGGTGQDEFTITDTLPAGLTYVSDTGSSAGFTCQANGQTVTCTGQPNLSTGSSVSFTLTVAVGSQAVPSVDNTASFTEEFNADNTPENDSDTDTVTVGVQATTTASPSPSPSLSPSPSESPNPIVDSQPFISPTASVAAETLPSTGNSALPFMIGGGVLLVLAGLALTSKRLARGSH